MRQLVKLIYDVLRVTFKNNIIIPFGRICGTDNVKWFQSLSVN